jgi:hypothetical protein
MKYVIPKPDKNGNIDIFLPQTTNYGKKKGMEAEEVPPIPILPPSGKGNFSRYLIDAILLPSRNFYSKWLYPCMK